MSLSKVEVKTVVHARFADFKEKWTAKMTPEFFELAMKNYSHYDDKQLMGVFAMMVMGERYRDLVENVKVQTEAAEIIQWKAKKYEGLMKGMREVYVESQKDTHGLHTKRAAATSVAKKEAGKVFAKKPKPIPTQFPLDSEPWPESYRPTITDEEHVQEERHEDEDDDDDEVVDATEAPAGSELMFLKHVPSKGPRFL